MTRASVEPHASTSTAVTAVEQPSSPVVRVAGMPVAMLAGLRCPHTAGRIDAILAADGWLAAEAEALSVVLHDLIGQHPDPPLRPRLVGLRRAVHAGRPPRPREWDDVVAAALPPTVVERVDQWAAQVRKRGELIDGLPDLLAAEQVGTVDAVRAAAADPLFRRTLARSSPTLDSELERWLAGHGEPRTRVVVRLARYLARAVTKTSPYGTFTVSGTARWAANGPALGPLPHADLVTVLELDMLLLTAVQRAVTDRLEHDNLALRVTPGLVNQGDRVTALGASPHEPVVTVGLTEAVRTCLRTADGPHGRPRGTVVAALVQAGGRPDAAGAFVDRLVALGVLELCPTVSGAAPLTDLARTVSAAGGDLARLAEPLRRLHDELHRTIPNTDLATHRARQHAVAEEAATVAELAGLPAAARTARTHRGAVAHEHVLAAESLMTCGLTAWQQALADLGVLRRWLAVHDPTLPLRLVLGSWMAARFGAGARMPFVLLHRAIREEIDKGVRDDLGGELQRWLEVAGSAPASQLTDSPVDRLRTLSELRQAAAAALDAGPDADGVVRVTPTTLTASQLGWPSWVTGPGRIACYVQPVGTDDPLRVVVNGVSTGYRRGLTRHWRLRGHQADGPDSTSRHRCRPEPVELSGVFGTALNVRMPSTRLEVEYPGTVSGRPARDRIPLGRLLAAHDPTTGLVGLTAPGHGPVRIVHLGLMVDQLLPPAARLAVRMSGFTVLAPGWSDPSPPTTAPGEVTATPRVEMGSVTVRRARWRVGVTGMPSRTPGEQDAAYLLRLARWRRRHGIPSRAFLHAGGPGSATGAAFDKSRKPLYVDWESWPLAATAERLLRAAPGPVVIEEAHPDPGAAPAGHRVIEMLVEVPGCDCDG